MRRLCGVALLSGQVRPTQLGLAADRSMLDLPVEPGVSLLDLWHKQIQTLAAALGIPQLSVRVLTNQRGEKPTLPGSAGGVKTQIELDLAEYRGTGGVLRDLAQNHDPEQFLLVANGAQILTQPLVDLTAALAEDCRDVSVISHRDGTPSGLMLVRCGALKGLSSVGFVDMKEQGLPSIAQDHHVRVVEHPLATGLPVRTRDNYIHALRQYHTRRHSSGDHHHQSPFHETWRPTFHIIEQGATLADQVRVHDSVVLRGAHVAAGAVLVRSVIGSGATITRGQMVVNQVVGG